MRLTPGPITTVANESITGRLLMDIGINKPDFMPTIMSMYPEMTPLMALLDFKGFKTKDVSMTSRFFSGT